MSQGSPTYDIRPYDRIEQAKEEKRKTAIEEEIGAKAYFILEQRGESVLGLTREYRHKGSRGEFEITSTGPVPAYLGRERRVRIRHRPELEKGSSTSFDYKENLEEEGTESIIHIRDKKENIDKVARAIQGMYREAVREAM